MQERRKCLTLREVDRKNGSPPFEQIARMLRKTITSGELRCGERLPTETKQAEQCGLARTTVRRAVQELRDTGFVAPTSGRGLRVARSPNASAALRPQPRLTQHTVLHGRARDWSPVVASIRQKSLSSRAKVMFFEAQPPDQPTKTGHPGADLRQTGRIHR